MKGTILSCSRHNTTPYHTTYLDLVPSPLHTHVHPTTILKTYTLTGPKWNSQNLTLHHTNANTNSNPNGNNGTPILHINANNRLGPFCAPYITLHRPPHNGSIVAAAKMSPPGWKRDFRIWVGNPDCTDLGTWTRVRCCGVWAGEYRFGVGGREFAWRRTRGEKGRGHRDFKLVEALPSSALGMDMAGIGGGKGLVNHDSFSDDSGAPEQTKSSSSGKGSERSERVIAVYVMNNTPFKTNRREAEIHFFEALLSEEVELWCLAAVFGLQEKISKNQDALMLASFGYGGLLWPLGRYM